MKDEAWSVAKALWAREGWSVVAMPDLHETYFRDEGFIPVVGTRIILKRGLDRVEVAAATERDARRLIWEKMEGE